MVRSRFVPAVFSAAITLRSSSPGPVAQLAEQQTLNLRVVGSIPTRLTSFAPRQLRRSSRHSVASATRRHGRPALSLWSYGSASPFSLGRELRFGKPSELNRYAKDVAPSR